jgi:cell division protease FtsH
VEEVVKIYMKNKRFDENVNSRDIAHKLLRQSPASIEGIINEACLIAIKKNNGIIREQDLNEAYLKKIMKGHVKENVEVPEEDSLLVAYHEAGHALVAVIEGVPVQSVTIMPTTTGAGGVTVMNQQNKNYYRKSDYENQIRISYGGRASEEVIFGEDLVTTGASADIQNATNMIRNAATYYGFDLCDTKKHAPLVYKEISQENLEKAANKYYKETVELLAQNVDALKAIAQELIENGTITGKRVAAIYTSFQTVDMLME